MPYDIYIDESGTNKLTNYSVFAFVYVNSEKSFQIENVIKSEENKLKVPSFHWSKTVWKVKEQFLDRLLKIDFQVKIAVMKNPIKPNKEFERILPHLIIEKNVKNIFLDGKKPKWYNRKIKKLLTDKNISIKKLRTVKASQFPGIRLADMVAGLSRSYFDNKHPERYSNYFKRLEKKIVVIIN